MSNAPDAIAEKVLIEISRLQREAFERLDALEARIEASERKMVILAHWKKHRIQSAVRRKLKRPE